TVVFRFSAVPHVEAVQLISSAHASLIEILKSIFPSEITLRINSQGTVFRKTIIHTPSDQMGNIHLFIVAVLIQYGRNIRQCSNSVFVALSESPSVLIIVGAINVKLSGAVVQ